MKPEKYKPKYTSKFKDKVCTCGAKPHWGIGKLLCSSGQIKHPWYCRQCGKCSTIYEPNHPHLIYTYVFDDRGDLCCEKCGMPGAEVHHWAPRHLFGDECEKWPVGYFCQPCHSKWHQIVTPNMSETRHD